MNGLEEFMKEGHYIKIHFMVNVGTKETLTMEIIKDDAHNLDALPNLIMDASRYKLIAEACVIGHMIHLKSTCCLEG
jgi:hypothetical protein